MRIQNWHYYFMAMAKLAATRSGCNSRPTGAVIVENNRIIATGYNGTLPGAKQCTDISDQYCQRRSIDNNDTGDKKYQDCPSIHAEQNALNQLIKNGTTKLENASIYCTLFPCIFCMKNLLSVGIYTIYYELQYTSNDPDRDSYWQNWIKEYGVYTKEIIIPPESKAIIFDTVFHITSKRRL